MDHPGAHRRRVTVLVLSSPIGDGEIPIPQVGDIGTYPLMFDDCAANPDDPTVAAITATAEPLNEGRPTVQSGGDPHAARRVEWSVLLRGDGWSATWHSRRPVVGQVDTTGRLRCTFGYETSGRIRGRITRIRIDSEYWRRDSPDTPWQRPGTSSYRDVDTVPRFFGADQLPVDGLDVCREVGVAVDLDLLDVPAVPPRPPLVPSSISADGRDLWIVDRELPLLVHLGADRHATEHLLFGPTFADPPAVRTRRVWAHPGGCWITGWDGLHHCTIGGDPEVILTGSVGPAAVNGDTLLAVAASDTDTAHLMLHRPGADPVRVAPTAEWGRVRAIGNAHNGFVVLCQPLDTRIDHHGTSRMVHVDTDGHVDVGATTILPITYQPAMIGFPPPSSTEAGSTRSATTCP